MRPQLEAFQRLYKFRIIIIIIILHVPPNKNRLLIQLLAYRHNDFNLPAGILSQNTTANSGIHLTAATAIIYLVLKKTNAGCHTAWNPAMRMSLLWSSKIRLDNQSKPFATCTSQYISPLPVPH